MALARITKGEIVEAPREAGDATMMLGNLGLVELRLTDAEEKVLAKPVEQSIVSIKPQKHPVPYISHPHYTRWLNEAFGRTGWTLVPIAKPMSSGKDGRVQVVVPYVLHVHRQPVAFAMGEQEYFEKNKDQTYGDAVESTIASGLRRCMKRLGVGLELWDRRWINSFLEEHCVRVKTDDGPKWRRKDDPPFFDEHGRAPAGSGERDERQERHRSEPGPERPAAGHHRESGEPITDGQLRRFHAIASNSGRDSDKVKEWLEARFGWTSSRQITRDKYEYVVACVESPNALPEG